MRNPKKILGLALVLVMALSLVTFANAADTTDFSNDAEIDHPTAANTLVNLGIIDGVGNNNFNLAGSVKRGDLCKIIAVILKRRAGAPSPIPITIGPGPTWSTA